MGFEKVIVRAPATSANMGSGFDSLGMALEMRDETIFQLMPCGESRALVMTADGRPADDRIPLGSDNLAIRAFDAVFREVGRAAPPVEVRIVNRIPVARGLGSSAAAIVAGLIAADTFLGGVLDLQARLNLAARIEGHPDNTAACILGGVTASSLVGSRVLWAKAPVPVELWAVLAIPDFHVSTEAARNVLPRSVQYSDAVFNVSRVALLVASLASGAYANLRYAMEDRLHQPYRASLVPGLVNAVHAACDAGALGAYMSGAGPSIMAIIGADTNPEPVSIAMLSALSAAKVKASSIVLPMTPTGAVVETA
ncbi:MAG: homoserine kinase [Clostridia bacterium]|nr:homoserine kinase [Clostridia bacterium]